jgi:hypothetical protein
MPRPINATIIAAALWAYAAQAQAEPAPFMMRARVGALTIEGQPIEWSKTQILLLGRDGALYDFKPADAQDSKKTAKGFIPYTNAEMQAVLRAEFDRRYELSATAHFVVAYPQGRGREWADRLETLYRGFTHYMSVRGFPTTEPPVPLAAVVFRSRDDYYQYAAAHGTPLSPGTLGHYDA